MKKILAKKNIKSILDAGCGGGSMLHVLNNNGYFNDKKYILYFPLIHILLKFLRIKDREIYNNNFFNMIKKIKIPITSYYNWEIVMIKTI